ncbi:MULTISPECIES: O-antigen ligase family protein [unclassified Janibacter]|uniref:O-antigen ligase family protein n=1 Tax=unclassified Janibacter TaxID=2649294 RepID=UPI003D03B6A4
MASLDSRAGHVGAAAAGIALALALGGLVATQPLLAVVLAGAALVLGLVAVDAALVPLMFLPLLYVAFRVGGGGVDLSVSDVALGLATAPALLLAKRPFSPPLRNLLWIVAIYQVATLFTVIANPYLANLVEWVHAWFLIGGALVLGWAVGRGGHGPTGLRLMLAAASVLSGWVMVQAAINLSHGSFEPVYLPYGMHKNFLGTVLAITALIAYVRPVWLGMSRRIGAAIFWWLAVGVALSQSRQAIVGLGVALVILVLRSKTDRRRSKAILFAVGPAVVLVMTLVRDQVASGNEFNSVFQRLTWFEDALAIWQESPVWGVGLRWWYTDRFAEGFQPPNAEIEVLTSSGIIGLIGFLVLMVGSIVVLWRVTPTYGTLALLAVLSRFVQGQLDLFWVAAQCSIPFAIAGICLGVQALHEDEDIVPDTLDMAGGHQTDPRSAGLAAAMP